MSFDRSRLASLSAASEAGHTFEPTYPDGTGIGATITVRGPESAAVRAVLQQQMQQMQQLDEAARLRGRKPASVAIDDLVQQTIDLAVAYTIGWAGFTDGDTPLEPTPANLRALYTDHRWIRTQVISEAQDLGNFVRPPLPPCSSTPVPSSTSI